MNDAIHPVSHAPSSIVSPTRWRIDRGHSAVGFSVRHMMIARVRGEIGSFRGEVSFDPARPEATTIEAFVDVASIDTREPKRDEDLRGPLFFDVEHHPEMRFVSKAALPAGEDGLDVTGALTIRGVTRDVVLAIREIRGPAMDLRGQLRRGARASTHIERSDFGMTWNKTLDAGGVVVGERVDISLELSLVAIG